MKTRNSLVSNSSSASFICYWRCLKTTNDNKQSLNKDQAIKRLMDEYDDMDLSKTTELLLANTINTAVEGTFKTEGSTSMYNNVEDVPQYLAYLLVALKIESGYELIDFRVEDYGG